jgi:cell division protein FtsB
LSVKIHQNAIQAISKDNAQLDVSQTTASLAGVKDGVSLFESYLVTSLKKQNRELKDELRDKVEQVDKLKRDIKLAKGIEIEHELQSYIEECQRLRSMLENTVL